MRRALVLVFVAACGGAQPGAPAPTASPPPSATSAAGAGGADAARFTISEEAARAVCPTDPLGEIGAALPALVAGCNVVPPWTADVPFVRCPSEGCPRPCAKTTNRFGAGTETGVTRYRYDAQGRLVEEIAKGADGHVIHTIRWDFASARRWHRSHSVTGESDFDLDANGRLTARENEWGRFSYERDATGKLVAERIEPKGKRQTPVFRYLYDDQARLRSREQTEPSPLTEFAYSFDARGLLDSAMIGGTEWHLHWEGSRPISAQRGAPVAGRPARDDLKITYDEQGRPATITDDTGGLDRFDYTCGDGP